MEDSVKELHVFGAETGSGFRYIKYAPKGYNDYGPNVSFVTEAKDATAIDINKVDTLIDIRSKILTKVSEGVELVKVEITTKHTPVDMGVGEILEKRQKVALAKLTVDDIHALGIEKIATYIKLRYHKADQ
jgi:hypothetical protein